MNTRHDLSSRVREIEHLWIPLADGARLAARAWLPRAAERAPAPAILEYVPYRKRDGTRWRDEPMHRWFAGHGYAVLRVDVRGSGDSDGLLEDEYTDREHADGLEVIAWIARQPWCTGAVGMLGKSWGGITALQIAQLAPPALRAVVAVHASDDRYSDDAHYMGGCLLNENLTWGAVLAMISALPPDPELAGAGWRARWRERLEAAPLYAETWMRHPLRDAYWQRASVRENYAGIRCPVYAIGGWADGYSDAVLRLVAGLGPPSKGLIGPWAHLYPQRGVPGPAIGFLQEALRWWNCWLAGADDGISREPRLRVWMQQRSEPRTFLTLRPGRWVAEASWPSARIVARRFALGERCLAEAGAAEPAGARGALRVSSPQTTGASSGSWCGFGLPGELPGDQRADDGRSLCFDSAPLAEPLEILGAPRVHLALGCDRASAFVAARVCDVAPEGSSARVTWGLANLAHEQGHARAAPLAPGLRRELTFELRAAAHVFPRGSRVRLALSTSYWPLVWPSPEPALLELVPAACWLELPARAPRAEDGELAPFEPPEEAASSLPPDDADGEPSRTLAQDLASGRSVLRLATGLEADGRPAPAQIPALGLWVAHALAEEFKIDERDPLSAEVEIVQHASLARASGRVELVTRTALSAGARSFALSHELRAEIDGELFLERTQAAQIPRESV